MNEYLGFVGGRLLDAGRDVGTHLIPPDKGDWSALRWSALVAMAMPGTGYVATATSASGRGPLLHQHPMLCWRKDRD